MRVAVLGASPNRERYSNQAVRLLDEFGHEVVPVNPGHAEIEGHAAVSSLDALEPGSVDTLTMYVGPERSAAMGPLILRLAPARVVFNPGSENPELAGELEAAGIEVLEACTLVMLRAGQF